MVGGDAGEVIAGDGTRRAAIHQDISDVIAGIGSDDKGLVVTIIKRSLTPAGLIEPPVAPSWH